MIGQSLELQGDSSQIFGQGGDVVVGKGFENLAIRGCMCDGRIAGQCFHKVERLFCGTTAKCSLDPAVLGLANRTGVGFGCPSAVMPVCSQISRSKS
jgi:hypothetical protein